MKLDSNFVLVICVFLGCLRPVKPMELLCKFENHTDGYNCRMFNILTRNNVTLSSVAGVHLAEKQISDLEVLYVSSSSTQYLPIKVCSLFKSLNKFDISTGKIKELSRDVFSECVNVKNIYIFANLISYLPEDVFYDLVNLTSVFMKSNKVTFLPSNVFSMNTKLKSINFDNNKLSIILAKIPKTVTSLSFLTNSCINKTHPAPGQSSIKSLIAALEQNCGNPGLQKHLDNIQSNEGVVNNSTNVKIMQLESEKKDLIESVNLARENCSQQLQVQNKSINDLVKRIGSSENVAAVLEIEKQSCQSNLSESSIKNSELEQEIEVLSANHSEVQNQVSTLFQEIISLKQNISHNELQTSGLRDNLTTCMTKSFYLLLTQQKLTGNLSSLLIKNAAQNSRVNQIEFEMAKVKDNCSATVAQLTSEVYEINASLSLTEEENNELNTKLFELDQNMTEASENCSESIMQLTKNLSENFEKSKLSMKEDRLESSFMVPYAIITFLGVGWIATIIKFMYLRKRKNINEMTFNLKPLGE